jgi:hypothetical protein
MLASSESDIMLLFNKLCKFKIHGFMHVFTTFVAFVFNVTSAFVSIIIINVTINNIITSTFHHS